MWFALFSIIFYILSLLLIAPFLMNSSEGKLSQSKTPFFLTALAAIILHAVSTFPLLEELASGQSFTLMEIASLMSVIIAALATLSMFLVSTMWFVLPIVYAFSIISLIFATFLSSHIIQMLNQNTLMLFHIGLSHCPRFKRKMDLFCADICDIVLFIGGRTSCLSDAAGRGGQPAAARPHGCRFVSLKWSCVQAGFVCTGCPFQPLGA